jgi:hypothetical protein
MNFAMACYLDSLSLKVFTNSVANLATHQLKTKLLIPNLSSLLFKGLKTGSGQKITAE